MRDLKIIVFGDPGVGYRGSLPNLPAIIVEDRSLSMLDHIDDLSSEVIRLSELHDMMMDPLTEDDLIRHSKAPRRFNKQADWKVSSGKGLRR